MAQCLQIIFAVEKKKDFVQEVLLKKARLLGVEGFAHEGFDQPEDVKMIICGQKDILEKLIDVLHQSASKGYISDIIIEPVMKEKDFRGVFRVIEQ